MNIHQESYDAIFLSPHFDDAVLSAGGKIIELIKRKKNVLIITFFTKGNDKITSQDARKFLQNSGVKCSSELFSKRKKEDAAAAQKIEAKVLHLNFTDALFRNTSVSDHPSVTPIYPTFDDVFSGVISELDHPLQLEVITDLEQLKAVVSRGCVVYAPLGVGKHVDHIICFEAARQVFGKRVIFWEDTPYRVDQMKLLSRISMLRKNGISLGTPILSILESSTTDQKKDAVQAYKTQLPGLLSAGLSDPQLQLERFYNVL